MMLSYARAALAAARRFSTGIVAPAAETGAVAAITRRDRRDILGRRIFNFIQANQSPILGIQQWLEEGNNVFMHELYSIYNELRKNKRYEHEALQVIEWMTQQPDTILLPRDYTFLVKKTAEFRGLDSLEKFTDGRPDQVKDCYALQALLRLYAFKKDTAKAEAVFELISKDGNFKSPIPYNCMLYLYISTGELSKYARMVEKLMTNTTPHLVNWICMLTFSTLHGDINAAEKTFHEMKKSKTRHGWKVYSLLAITYMKNSLHLNAASILKKMENNLNMTSKKDRNVYKSLINLYTKMEDKDGVRRICKKMKETFLKMRNEEYICVISSFVKLGESKEAEDLYSEWESVAGNDDSRALKTLAACGEKDIKMSEKMYNWLAKEGIAPSYITWELLTWACLKEMQMEYALYCFKRAVSSVFIWITDNNLVVELFKKLESAGDVEGAKQLLTTLREAGYPTAEVYNYLLRTYAKAGKVELDEEKLEHV